jgi:hypothetical protein
MRADGRGGQASQRRHDRVTVATCESRISASAHSRRIEFLLRGYQNRSCEASIVFARAANSRLRSKVTLMKCRGDHRSNQVSAVRATEAASLAILSSVSLVRSNMHYTRRPWQQSESLSAIGWGKSWLASSCAHNHQNLQQPKLLRQFESASSIERRE